MSPYAYEYDLFLHMVFRILKPHKNRKTPKQHNSSYIRFQRNHQYNYVRPDDSVNNTNKQKKNAHTTLSSTLVADCYVSCFLTFPTHLATTTIGAGCRLSCVASQHQPNETCADRFSLFPLPLILHQ